jgi:hypothetical protein
MWEICFLEHIYNSTGTKLKKFANKKPRKKGKQLSSKVKKLLFFQILINKGGRTNVFLKSAKCQSANF